MKYFELGKDEQKILKDYEAGKLKPAKNKKKEQALLKEYARQTLNKTRNINVRLSAKALQKIKEKAVEKGIPYQTLIGSIIHQYSIGKIKESSNF